MRTYNMRTYTYTFIISNVSFLSLSSDSEKMAIAASDYQLKWHSYGEHLHSSVATLLHSESFADVLLATSCGRHVAAHRFVLAACSSYLSHIFQTCHFGANTNAPIIVVGIESAIRSF